MNRRVLLLALVLVALFALFSRENGHANEVVSNWSPPELVLDDPNLPAELVAFQRSNDGRVHVLAYLNPQFGLDTLVYTWRDGNGNWTEAETIADFFTPTSSIAPVIAVDDDGSVHVLWWHDDLDTSELALYYAERLPAGGWSSPLELNPEIVEAQLLGLTADNGRVYARWRNNEGIFLLNRNLQGQWSAIEQVDSGQTGPGMALHVQDAAGNLHFIWDNDNQADPSQRGVYHRILSTAGVWGPIVRVSPEIADPNHFVHRAIADTDGNQVYVAWEQGDTEDINYPFYTVYTAEWSGSDWSAALPLTPPDPWVVHELAAGNGWAALWGVKSAPLPHTTHLWTRPAGGVWAEVPLDIPYSAVEMAIEANRLHFVWNYTDVATLQYRWRDQAGNYSTVETIDSGVIDKALFQADPVHLDVVWLEDDNLYYSHAEPLGPFDQYLPAVIR